MCLHDVLKATDLNGRIEADIFCLWRTVIGCIEPQVLRRPAAKGAFNQILSSLSAQGRRGVRRGRRRGRRGALHHAVVLIVVVVVAVAAAATTTAVVAVDGGACSPLLAAALALDHIEPPLRPPVLLLTLTLFVSTLFWREIQIHSRGTESARRKSPYD